MFRYSEKTQNAIIENFWDIEKKYKINITDPGNEYGKGPLIKDKDVVTLKEKDLEEKAAGLDKGTFLALYMLYLSYQNDLFIGPGSSDECIRLMLSSYFDKKWKKIPCIKLNSYQKNGYVNEPLFIAPNEIDKIIKYLNKVKKHLIIKN